MSTAVHIAAPTLLGVSQIAPRGQSSKWALLFAAIGVSAGVTGIALALRGRMDEAIKADITSIIFDLMAIVKALEAG